MGPFYPFAFTVPVDEFRSLPFPTQNGSRAKLGTCFVQVDDLPAKLKDWMAVNPRVPKFNVKEKLVGPVAKAMVRTLEEEPEKFALKNQGIYLLVHKMAFQKKEGGRGELTIEFADRDQHGLVNGGHTFMAIRQAVTSRGETTDPAPAYVRLHLMEGITPDDITELAEGLNRSMQVDDPSLENLRGRFDELRYALQGKPGEDQIAYRQGDPGEIHVVQILQMMSLFDLDNYPDRKTFPNVLFGHPKKVLQHFLVDMEDESKIFRKVLPKLHEILKLSDLVQTKLVPVLAKVKISDKKKGERVRSEKYRDTPAHFLGGTIGGNIPLGWLYPALGALRANMNPEAWMAGNFEWRTDPHKLVEDTAEELGRVIYQEHLDNGRKPVEVGRKEAAYRACYAIIAVALAEQGRLG